MSAPEREGYPGLFQRSRWRLVITGFFDDSGKESDPANGFVVLAGFVSVSSWGAFHERWVDLLFRHDLPGVHMKEIRGIATAKGWDLSKLNRVLVDFIGVIRDAGLVGFGVGVDLEAWRKIDPSIKKRFGNAQIFCCSRIMRRLMDRLRTARLQHEEITVVFDRDFEFARRRFGLFEELARLYPDVHANVAQVSFADSRSFHPLQAADLLAWETRRELVSRSSGQVSNPRWNELMAALPSGQIEFAAGEFWTEEWFDHELPKLQASLSNDAS